MLHACPRPVEAYSNSLPRDACSRAAEPCMQMREEPGRKASRSEPLGASQTRDRQISCASTRRPGGRVGTGCALYPGCTEFCSEALGLLPEISGLMGRSLVRRRDFGPGSDRLFRVEVEALTFTSRDIAIRLTFFLKP